MPSPRNLSRDQKVENLIRNHSMVVMGMFEEAFEDVADKLTEAMDASLAAASEATPSALGAAKGPAPKVPSMSPRVRMEIGGVLSEMRDEMASHWPKSPKVLKEYLSNPALDEGIKIVEAYDFHRPRLTDELTDEVLASYVFLLKGGDRDATKMFKQLSDWQRGLPKPPWAP